MALHVERKLLKWGNGFGIRLTASEVAELGVRAGDALAADVVPAKQAVDLSIFPLFSYGPVPNEDFQDITAEAFEEKMARQAKKRHGKGTA